ncbi:MAG: aldehyde dehydrogenase [Rhodobacteraceae bacterium]|nr:aldehyde dehydrogenase [Paracoccaceae bacterium]
MENAVKKVEPLASFPDLDAAVDQLDAAKDGWAQTSNAERIAILSDIQDQLMKVAAGWAETAARKKLIPENSSLMGEEWISGPYAVMAGCNGLLHTLSQMDGKTYLDHLKSRETVTGQTAVTVVPHNIWEHLLFSGVTAEVWMAKGVNKANLKALTAKAYDTPAEKRSGKVSLVLGAGNIAAIAPLDVFQKLFSENQVVILKMNPVNDYLADYLSVALKPLIDRDALRIVKGGADVGAYLCNHPDVEEIHITGAETSHDSIVWGPGEEGLANKKAGTPKITKRITSELGAVCPTIVVPGPWTRADLQFQAEHIATQKMHNSGFNCVACQMLILPGSWDKTAKLLKNVENVIRKTDPRMAYYPGAEGRLAEFENHGDNVIRLDRGAAPACLVVPQKDDSDAFYRQTEVFAPAFSTYEITDADPEAYLRSAIKYANENLHGTLGGNILIHPKTIRKIGKKKFEEIIAGFRYGTIAINAWTGLGFLATACPWGAFPGHTLDDVQSGIGFAHNTNMFDSVERVVVKAPFRPFPRNLLSGGLTLLPRPPYFVTNKKQQKLGMLLTRFQYKPSWFKLPRIFLNALLG